MTAELVSTTDTAEEKELRVVLNRLVQITDSLTNSLSGISEALHRISSDDGSAPDPGLSEVVESEPMISRFAAALDCLAYNAERAKHLSMHAERIA